MVLTDNLSFYLLKAKIYTYFLFQNIILLMVFVSKNLCIHMLF